MARWGGGHFHLTHMIGYGAAVTRQPEAITDAEAARRLLDEIAARHVTEGCRVKKYTNGVRIYDCKDTTVTDQSFEVHPCDDAQCGLMPSESEYGSWSKADRRRYVKALAERGLIG